MLRLASAMVHKAEGLAAAGTNARLSPWSNLLQVYPAASIVPSMLVTTPKSMAELLGAPGRRATPGKQTNLPILSAVD